jgi:hypothetical protein
VEDLIGTCTLSTAAATPPLRTEQQIKFTLQRRKTTTASQPAARRPQPA